MSPQAETFTIGVEEEYQIINPTTREQSLRVQQILPIARKALGEQVQPEVQLSQIEIGTPFWLPQILIRLQVEGVAKKFRRC